MIVRNIWNRQTRDSRGFRFEGDHFRIWNLASHLRPGELVVYWFKRQPAKGISAMDTDVRGLAEIEHDILIFEIPDDALERAAGRLSDGGAITIAYCTQDWIACGWPL